MRGLLRQARLLVTALALVGVTATTLVVAPALAADDPCADGNLIVCENSRRDADASAWAGGRSPEWDIDKAGDASIQGYSTDISVNLGERIDFKVDTEASAFDVDIYRVGWYGGAGARKIASLDPGTIVARRQPLCLTDPATELLDCGNWSVSASWTVPGDAVSGVYLAKLTRPDTGGSSHIVFVVRDDSSKAAMVFQTSDTSWQAYNTYGGSSFYQGEAHGRAYKLSYNRPFATRGLNRGQDFFFANEYPMIRFLERNGYDVTYTTGVDSDRRGQLLKNHKVFLSVGHDEYWSAKQRTNVEAARDAGVHLAFFSGNEVYWRTRWEPSQDGTSTPYRTLVCYKETWADAKIDPSKEWTGTWRDRRFAETATVGEPENALTGTAYVANSTDLALQVSTEQARLRLWRNTSISTMTAGQTATLAPHTVGYESNEDLDNGYRPEGLIRMSTTVGPTPEYLRDEGRIVTPGTTTHHLTLYRARSGALVFSAGTIQYAWGLDPQHDGAQEPADPRLQQATINLFADMGVQPTTLMDGMVEATASTDKTAPTAAITWPKRPQVKVGEEITVQGSAADNADGRVAAVEVSLDGGDTWRPAMGTTFWSYTFTATRETTRVLARAIDDSVNIGPASPPLAVRVTTAN
ncbi:N,N-dimethylformamidase beta subunit family domain-containing protein [Luedemannella helvata]|uniref:N,N-dimethylformamidase beta subunit-like C-terminal domain-containing protein n=1 Tax=Luedemannella helvata TaxID=349315 RepID=A0ABP4W9A1_9ACTN